MNTSNTPLHSKATTDVTRCIVCGRTIRDSDACDYVYDDSNKLLGAIHPEHYGGLIRGSTDSQPETALAASA